MLVLVPRQAIEASGQRIEFDVGIPIRIDTSTFESSGERHETSKLRRLTIGNWDGEPRHERRVHVRRYLESYDVVRDEAVQQSEQAVLARAGHRSLRAEKRVRRDGAGGQYCGNERELVGCARDVAVGETGAAEAVLPIEELCRDAFGDAGRRAIDQGAKWFEMLPFDDGQHVRVSARDEVMAVVGRIQLAAKANVPAAGVAEVWNGVDNLHEDVEIARTFEFRNREMVSIPLLEHAAGEHDRPRVGWIERGLVRQRVEPRCVAQPKTTVQPIRSGAARRGQQQKADVAVDWKNAVAIGEPEQAIDVESVKKGGAQ